MLIGFLAVLAVVAVSFYVAMMVREVPGFAEQRFGTLEELPENLGKWCEDESSQGVAARAKGLRREVRLLHEPDAGFLSGDRIVRQVRYRDLETDDIVRVEPDRVYKRKRRKS